MSGSITIRDACDRAVDQLGFGWSYPLRDLPVSPITDIVPFGCPARIEVACSQIHHRYQLYELVRSIPGDENSPLIPGNPEGSPVYGTGGTIELQSETITEDIRKFRVHVVEDRTDLEAWLDQDVEVRQGINKKIEVVLDTPTVGFNQPVVVSLPLPQEGIQYQLVDSWLNPWSNPITTESNTPRILNSFPLKENLRLYVHATNIDVESGVKDILNTVIEPMVGAYPGAQVAFVEPLVEYAAPGTIRLTNAQPGLFYQWVLASLSHPQCVDPALPIELQGEPVWSGDRTYDDAIIGPDSDSQVGALNPVIDNHGPGSGTTDHDLLNVKPGSQPQAHPDAEGLVLDLLVPKNYEDATYKVVATRYVEPPVRSRGKVTPPAEHPRDVVVELTQQPAIAVLPQHNLPLTWQGPSRGSRQGIVKLNRWQCGVEYQLVPHDHLEPIKRTYTTSPGTGVASAAVNVDFAVGHPGLNPVELHTGLLKANSKYYVKARKIYSDNVVYLGRTTQTNDRYFRGPAQKPLYFNGTGNYAFFGDGPILGIANSSYTIECWYRPAAPIESDQTLCSLFPADGSPELRIHLVDQVPCVTQGEHKIIAEQVLNRYLWTHIGVTYNAQTGFMLLYVNGEVWAYHKYDWPAFATDIDTLRNDQPAGAVFLAKNGEGNYLKGRLAEFRVWNVARKWYDVQSKFNHPILPDTSQPIPFPSSLIGYWPMNEGSGHDLRSALPGGTDASKVGARWQ